MDSACSVVHAFSAKEPWWTIWVTGPAPWKTAAAYVVAALSDFTEDHYDALAGAAGK